MFDESGFNRIIIPSELLEVDPIMSWAYKSSEHTWKMALNAPMGHCRIKNHVCNSDWSIRGLWLYLFDLTWPPPAAADCSFRCWLHSLCWVGHAVFTLLLYPPLIYFQSWSLEWTLKSWDGTITTSLSGWGNRIHALHSTSWTPSRLLIEP